MEQTLEVLKGAAGLVTGMNLCVVGGGFVGLVSSVGFAQFGHSVVCVENDPQRLEILKSGRVPFYERDLEPLLQQNLAAGRIRFCGDLSEAVAGQDVIFISVGTPSQADGRTDRRPLERVVQSLSTSLSPGQIVVLKSTVPVGTGSSVQQTLSRELGSRGPVTVVNNPEFLREGSAVYDFFHPQRIVIGGEDPDSVAKIAQVYRIGMTRSVPIVTTNRETAEMIKYASNAFIALKVGFINEMAALCDRINVNVLEVARAMGMDPRIGDEYLVPGPGWGGSCLGKDLLELEGLAASRGYSPLITHAVQEANLQHHDHVVGKIRQLVGSLSGARIGLLGLAFKAGTSDVRDSPALEIARRLVAAGAQVSAFDPEAGEEARRALPELTVVDSAYAAGADADCVAILTEWHQFQSLDFARLAAQMRLRNLVDARNLLVPEMIRRYGFQYSGMGQS